MSGMEGKAARVEVSKPGGERVSIPLLCILTDHMFLLENPLVFRFARSYPHHVNITTKNEADVISDIEHVTR